MNVLISYAYAATNARTIKGALVDNYLPYYHLAASNFCTPLPPPL